MKPVLNFQLIFLSIFGLIALVSFVVFAGLLPFPKKDAGGAASLSGNVVVWGTLPQETVRPYFEEFNSDKLIIEYKAIEQNKFDDVLLNALATDTGPDLILWGHQNIIRHRDKLLLILYQNLSRGAFQNTFIRSSSILVQDDGILALPILADPMLLFSNNRILSSSYIAKVPEDWDGVQEAVKKITRLTDSGKIIQSGIAFGAEHNIYNTKEILSALIFQQGLEIVSLVDNSVDLAGNVNGQATSAEDAFSFFTTFSNPAAEIYSWNTSLPESRGMFISGNLGFYVGHAMDMNEILAKNPNLDFSVSVLPQRSEDLDRVTSGKLYVLAMTNNAARNIDAATYVYFQFAYSPMMKDLAQSLNLAPAHRDLLADPGDDDFLETLYNSALIMQTWFDPDEEETRKFFNRAVRSIRSGAAEVGDAVNTLSGEISRLL